MNQIAHCDWLPERARCSCSGLPAVSRMKYFPESHIINPLLTKFVRSRWDIGLVLFCEFMDLDFVSVHKHAKKRTWPISSHLDRTNLVNNPYIINRIIHGRLEISNLSARIHIRHLTRSLRSLVRYRCEHSKINSISPRAHVLFSIYFTLSLISP